jgi:hypothetical protein
MVAVVLVLLRTTGLAGVGAGEIHAVLAYVWLVLQSLDRVPTVVQQLGRLHDIRRRLEHGAGPRQRRSSQDPAHSFTGKRGMTTWRCASTQSRRPRLNTRVSIAVPP